MNAYQANAQKRRLQMRFGQVNKVLNFRPKSITSLTLMLFFVIGAFYIVIVTVVSTKGNNLRDLDIENQQLQGENERLEVEAARLKSLKVINESATGEVEVGNEATGTTQTNTTPATQTTQPITTTVEGGLMDAAVLAAEVEAEPKLVRTKQQKYLPSYYGSLASK